MNKKNVIASVVVLGTLVLVGMSKDRSPIRNTISIPSVAVNLQNTIQETTNPKLVTTLEIESGQVVQVVGPIGDNGGEIAAKISELALNQKPIFILIDSPGGSVLDGAKVLSAMQASQVPVYTVCMGLCASMAFIIHQYGTERYAVDRSILMAHPASGGLSGTLEQMQSRLGTIKRYVDKMSAFIAKRNGLTLDQFQAMSVSEMWLDAEDATERKFNDKIVNLYVKGDKLPIFSVSSQTKFKLNWK